MLQSQIQNTYEPNLDHSFNDKQSVFNTKIPNLPNCTSPLNEFSLLYDNIDAVSSIKNDNKRIKSDNIINTMKQYNKTCNNFTNQLDSQSDQKIHSKLTNLTDRRQHNVINIKNINFDKNNDNSSICKLPNQYKNRQQKQNYTIKYPNLFSYIKMYDTYIKHARIDQTLSSNIITDQMYNNKNDISLNRTFTCGDLHSMRIYYNKQIESNNTKKQLINYINSIENTMRTYKPTDDIDKLAEYRILQKNINMSANNIRTLRKYDSSLLMKTIDNAIQQSKIKSKIGKFSNYSFKNNFKYNIPINDKSMQQTNDIKSNICKFSNYGLKNNLLSFNFPIDNEINKNLNLNLDSILAKKLIDYSSSIRSSQYRHYRWLELYPVLETLKRRNEIRPDFKNIIQSTVNLTDHDRSSIIINNKYNTNNNLSLISNKNSCTFSLDSTRLRYRPIDQKNIMKIIDSICLSLSMKSRLSTRNKFYIEYEKNRNRLSQLTAYYKILKDRPISNNILNININDQNNKSKNLLDSNHRTVKPIDSTNQCNIFINDKNSEVQSNIINKVFNPYHLVDSLDKKFDNFHS